MSFTLVEYTPSELREKAEAFLAHHSLLRLPISINRIVGRKVLDLAITPIPNLRQVTGMIGFLSSDCTEISVDQEDMAKRPYQYRFTVAHEIAHYILHKDIVEYCHAKDMTQWKDYLRNESTAKWTIMERQADEFARTLLVPSELLREAVQPLVDQARLNNVELRELGRVAKKRVSIMLEPTFQVPSNDLYMRLEDEDLP